MVDFCDLKLLKSTPLAVMAIRVSFCATQIHERPTPLKLHFHLNMASELTVYPRLLGKIVVMYVAQFYRFSCHLDMYESRLTIFRLAFSTGASAGIGKASAVHFAACGANLVRLRLLYESFL